MKLQSWIANLRTSVRLPESRSSWIGISMVILTFEVGGSFALWGWLNGDESASTTIRNIGFIIAGSVAVPLAIWRSVVADRQASAAQRQAKTGLQQATIAQRGLLNERYQKGAEMLGSQRLPVRLGGIYALRSLAKEHPEEYHVQIMRLLCAYVRYPSKSKRLAETGQTDEKGSPIRLDVGAAMAMIVDRGEQGVALETEAGSTVYLNNADLRRAEFAHAKLIGAVLSGANLSHTKFYNAKLSGADLVCANLSDANFWRANLSNADLTHANLTNSTFIRANLTGAYLNDAKAANADFRDAIMPGVDLTEAKMPCATLVDADLTGARLIGTMLRDAKLVGTKLPDASLEYVNLSGANLKDANLSGANLKDANLSGANLMHVTNLTQAQLDEARADPDNPPKLDGVLDAETGKLLVWHGKPLNNDV